MAPFFQQGKAAIIKVQRSMLKKRQAFGSHLFLVLEFSLVATGKQTGNPFHAVRVPVKSRRVFKFCQSVHDQVGILNKKPYI
jgi:hypothetical protein